MIEQDLFSFIVSSVPAISSRVYHVEGPQDATKPFLTYQKISAPRDLNHDGPDEHVIARYQVDIWAETGLEALTHADTLRVALNGYRGDMGSTTVDVARLDREESDYEPNSMTHRVSQDYLINYQEV